MGKFNVIAIVAGFLFSSGTLAGQHMSKDVYKTEKDRIELEYKAQKARCDSLAGNARDICLVEAKGGEEVAEADLEAQYEPSRENRYKARVARAEADYAVAKERCDDRAGDAKEVCLKEAKAAEAVAKADAEREK
jgi:hypothetical protein